jgi:hypothetical protein
MINLKWKAPQYEGQVLFTIIFIFYLSIFIIIGYFFSDYGIAWLSISGIFLFFLVYLIKIKSSDISITWGILFSGGFLFLILGTLYFQMGLWSSIIFILFVFIFLDILFFFIQWYIKRRTRILLLSNYDEYSLTFHNILVIKLGEFLNTNKIKYDTIQNNSNVVYITFKLQNNEKIMIIIDKKVINKLSYHRVTIKSNQNYKIASLKQYEQNISNIISKLICVHNN